MVEFTAVEQNKEKEGKEMREERRKEREEGRKGGREGFKYQREGWIKSLCKFPSKLRFLDYKQNPSTANESYSLNESFPYRCKEFLKEMDVLIPMLLRLWRASESAAWLAEADCWAPPQSL